MPDIFVSQNHKGKQAAQTPPQPNEPSPKPKGRRPHMFSSFCENPTDISFQNQEEDETILLFLRRHFITNLPWIFITLVLLILPQVVSLVIDRTGTSITFVPGRFIVFLLLFYYLLVLTYALVCFFTWFFNISLITDKKIVDIDFSELVYKNVSATKISLIQDTSYTQIGVIRSIFDYGDVMVQTAGTLDNFDFLAVPKPERVIQIVEELIGKKENND